MLLLLALLSIGYDINTPRIEDDWIIAQGNVSPNEIGIMLRNKRNVLIEVLLRDPTTTRRYKFEFRVRDTHTRVTTAEAYEKAAKAMKLDPHARANEDLDAAWSGGVAASGGDCDADAERDEKIARTLVTPSDIDDYPGLSVVRAAFDRSGRRDYLVILYWKDGDARTRVYHAPRGATPRLISTTDEINDERLGRIDINHDGVDEIVSSFRGNRYEADSFWRWDGSALVAMNPY